MLRITILFCCLLSVVCSDEPTKVDPSEFLDTVVKLPHFLEKERIHRQQQTFAELRRRSNSRTNGNLRGNRNIRTRRQSRSQRLVRRSIDNRNVNEVSSASEVFVIGTHLGKEITKSLQKSFGDVFSNSQINQLQQKISRAVKTTTRSFDNSAFFIDAKSGELKAFVRADDFAGRAGKSFQRSDLLGKTVAVGNENFTVVKAKNFSPIIIDMDGNNKPDVAYGEWRPHAPKFFAQRTVLFDISGDGNLELMEWLGKKDALLVWPEIDGSVVDGHNLFGTAGGFKDGYAKMAILLDVDKNGWLEKKELQGLFLWQDRNGDACAQKDEMKDVLEYGIEKISVSHENFVSHCYVNGKKVRTWDWWPAGFELQKTE